MENKITAWLVTLLGIFLILPLAGVTQMGTATSGILGWLIAVAVLIIGILKLMNK
jgi:hypothetical protein